MIQPEIGRELQQARLAAQRRAEVALLLGVKGGQNKERETHVRQAGVQHVEADAVVPCGGQPDAHGDFRLR